MIVEEFFEKDIVRELGIRRKDRKEIVGYMKDCGYTPSIGVTYELNKIDKNYGPEEEYCMVSDIKYIEENIESIPNLPVAYLTGNIKIAYYRKEEAIRFMLAFNDWCRHYIAEANFPTNYLKKIREKYWYRKNPEGREYYGHFHLWPLNIKKDCVRKFLEEYNTAILK